jgi:hypothetical protein
MTLKTQMTSYSSAPLKFYFVPCAYDISSLCLDYDAQLRVLVFIEQDLRWLFWVNFGFDFPLAVEPSATGGQ